MIHSLTRPIVVVTFVQPLKEDLMNFLFGFLRKSPADCLLQQPFAAIAERECDLESFGGSHPAERKQILAMVRSRLCCSTGKIRIGRASIIQVYRI